MKNFQRMHFQTLSLFALSLFLGIVALAQAPTADKEKEKSGVHHQTVSSGPIVVKWPMKNLKGNANLMINSDGTYLFSGVVKDKKAGRDFDIAVALKSSSGGIIVFHYAGDAADGVQWSKQGKSDILKDDFQTFSSHDWSGEWRLPLSAESIAKRYEEREKKKEKLKKEEEEAIKRHDEKVAAEKKAARERIEKQEIAEAQAAAQRNQQSGGSSIGSEISGIASTVGSVVSTISSVGEDIAGLF